MTLSFPLSGSQTPSLFNRSAPAGMVQELGEAVERKAPFKYKEKGKWGGGELARNMVARRGEETLTYLL